MQNVADYCKSWEFVGHLVIYHYILNPMGEGHKITSMDLIAQERPTETCPDQNAADYQHTR